MENDLKGCLRKADKSSENHKYNIPVSPEMWERLKPNMRA